MEELVMTGDFWRGKRVLITGHTGFKGSWLSLWLSHLGAHVSGYSLAPQTSQSNFVVSRVREKLQSSIEADIRDLSVVMDCIAAHRPEIVFHMAAQPLVRYSYQNPVETFQTNVIGTVNVLEAIRQTPSAKAVVVITSDKCYENREWVWGYRENESMGGHDPYSSSKGCTELVAASYRSSFFSPEEHAKHGVGLATVRAGNVIGGGDWSPDRLVPDLLKAHAQGTEVLIRNPAAIRPWQFVLEPLGGYMTLAERLFENGAAYAEAWNFGPREGDALPVGTLIELLSSRLDDGIRYRVDSEQNLHEAMLLKLDCSKAAARLSWHPRTSINDTLQLIADWQNSLLSGDDMQAVSLAQICAFQSINQGA
jgi:CDP-glucose 4,6-dehydratase